MADSTSPNLEITYNNKFYSTNIEVLHTPSDNAIQDFIRTIRDEEKKNTKGAVHLFFPMKEPKVLTIIDEHLRDFKFRGVYNWKSGDTQYMEFYHWMPTDVPDKVPAFATSIVGATVLLYHGDQALCIVEKGRFGGKKKFPGGAVNLGENMVQAALREVKEEVGLSEEELDLENMKLVGGYTQGNARPGAIGDQFSVLAIPVKQDFKSLMVKMKTDDTEIKSIHVVSMTKVLSEPAEQQTAEFLGDALQAMTSVVNDKGLSVIKSKNGWKFV